MVFAGAAFHDNKVLQRSIHALKYKGQRSLARLLVWACFPGLPGQDLQKMGAVLVPVPLFKMRERERGFNQAQELAGEIAAVTGLALRVDLLTRCRATQPQAQLHRTERLKNVRDAFMCRGPAPPYILLVDDVTTTMSTLHACAAELRRGGATWVGALVLARA